MTQTHLLVAFTAVAIASARPTLACQNLPSISLYPPGAIDLEDRLLAAIDAKGADKRLDNSDVISSLVAQLEASRLSVPRPAIAPQIYGRWRLLRTAEAGAPSPARRKMADATRFDMFQDIVFADDDRRKLLVSQVVRLGDSGEVRASALASTSACPLPDLTDRGGAGEAAADPARPDSRVRFVFDEGEFGLGRFKIPYPVPFKIPLFGGALKGWMDITYLSDRIRISRGNRGMIFVLKKEEDGC